MPKKPAPTSTTRSRPRASVPSRPPAPPADGKETRVRFVTAASLFDGHDAAINIMRRILQSSGAEVIHLGHNRSVSEIVTAALQEDAQAIAISSYQGGHVEFFKFTLDSLRKEGIGHVKVFGGGGGTITLEEAKELERYGVAKLYSPNDGRALGLQGIIEDMLRAARRHPLSHVDWDALAAPFASPRALAQALTCLELGEDALTGEWASRRSVFEALRALSAKPGKGTVVGLTGTGGAGKSSLTDELCVRLLEHDPKARVAILAVDPTRKRTGGALLGDRLRINSVRNPRMFMRSFATREANVSVSRATKDAVGLLGAAGFDWIFVETGGIGQADTSIVELAEINVYVMTPEFGAPTQLEKINMLDYADLVVINKIDKPGGLDAMNEVRRTFRRNHLDFEPVPPPRYPVFGTIASRFLDPGVDAVFRHLVALRGQSPRRRPLAEDHEVSPASAIAIIPRERTQYLSEISGAVRRYRHDAMHAARAAARIEALDRVLDDGGLSDPARQELVAQKDKAERALDPECRDLLVEFEELDRRYREDVFTFKVRSQDVKVPMFYESLSRNKIRKVAPPRFLSRADLMKFLLLENLPGYFPYTAGVFPFKRTEENPKRQFAGEGGPTRTNARFHLLCDGEKAKRLSTAFDSVTLYGEDPDERPDIFGKIGESGVSVCTLDDAAKLYAGFDLCDPSTSVSMTINGPAPMLLAFYFNTAIDQQVDRFRAENKREPTKDEMDRIRTTSLRAVRGTVQADILKEDQAQNTCIFSTEFALRMMGDIQQYFVDNDVRNYYSVSVSGYHIAEAGANPITQLAFTLANGFTYVEYYLARGMSVDEFAPNFSFFFSNALDPEYTVIGRVARRVWAIAMKRLYRAGERSQKLKYHIQTSGRSLHAQEISFNDIRTTLQALLAFFDNCNSLHTNAYDEAVTTPTEESVRRAMAIQLILTSEFGWAKNENPLQGSFFIEELTDLVEEAVLAEFDRLSARGGVLGAMEAHYQRSRIQEESLHYERLKHSGGIPIVGVNTFLAPQGEGMKPFKASDLTRASYDEKHEQIRSLREFQKRHTVEAARAVSTLKTSALRGGNVFAALMDAARVCSLGQMSRALYEIGGQYRRAM